MSNATARITYNQAVASAGLYDWEHKTKLQVAMLLGEIYGISPTTVKEDIDHQTSVIAALMDPTID